MRMRPLSILVRFAAGIFFCLGAAGAVLAQEASNPPGRVAQLSYAAGGVDLEPAGTSTWVSAALNRPVTLGDKIWAGQNSRAELDIGDAVIRLGSMTGFSFLNLDDQTAQMQVTAGTVIVHVNSLASGEQDEIDTPNLALTLQQPGTYRVEVSESGDTTIVKVDQGAALASGGGQSYPVAAQQSVTFTGTNSLSADYAMLGAPDSLDEWSMQRDQEQARQSVAAQQYVSPDVVGANDLSSYGAWQSTPDWGYAWFPSVAVGWAPYTMGNWAWVSPWGWTWVDAEPWGFAPFHYGRWGYWHRRWCWIPGPRRKRPMYAPALVGWVGGEHGRVPGRMGPHVGWFPLGPHDVYVPGYHVNPRYVRDINIANTRITNTTYITSVYEGHVANVRFANSEVPGAVTAVPRNVFTSAQPVGPHRVILARRGGEAFRATTAPPAIMPVRQSVLGIGAGRIARGPPRAMVDRPVVARLAPPRGPVSFAREQAAIRANGGRPLPVAQLARLRPNTPAAPVRFATPPVRVRSGLEWHTAPGRGAPVGPGMSARERMLQQPALPPARAPRNDRPAWAQRQPRQLGTPAARPNPERYAPPQRQAPLQWRVPPRRETAPQSPPERRFVPPPRQTPEQRFVPPPRQMPEQRFVAPERRIPEQRFAPPPRQMPPPRFTPPPRPAPQQRFSPPSYSPPRQQFAPPPAPPRAAPARPPESRPSERPPRADAASLSLRTGYAQQWRSPPPMYRPQGNAIHHAMPARMIPVAPQYRAPLSAPPMYRPVPVGNAAPAQLGSRRFPAVRGRRVG
ncbi:MAG: hypothetical protein HIU85_14265 [Proteobacteria bacterium]|nr:hypothetical protein [Pseudomonadota bacterium]